MKRFFLCISAIALALSWMSDANADALLDAQTAAMDDYGIVSAGGFTSPGSYCYVTSTGGLVVDGVGDTTGSHFKSCFVGYAISGGITTDGELKQFNGSLITSGTDFIRVGRSVNGWDYAVKSDGSTYRFSGGLTSGGDVLSGVLKAQWYGGAFGSPNTPGCTVFSNGSATCKNYFGTTVVSGGTDVVDAEFEYPGYAGGYAVLHSGGSIESNYFFTDGPYRSVTAGYWTGDGLVSKVCAIRRNGIIDCKNTGASWVTTYQPTFAVRNCVLGESFGICVKASDWTIWKWDSTGLSQIGSNAGGQPIVPANIPQGSVCKKVTIPDTANVTWINPGFFSIPSSTTAFTWKEGTSPIPSNCSSSDIGQALGGKKCGDVGTLGQYDSNENFDRVTVYNYFTGSILREDSFTASGTTRSLLIRDDQTGVPVMKFGAIRSGIPYAANVWQFFGVQNPSTQRNWAYEIGSDGSSTPIYATGGQATIVYGNGRSSVVLQLNETAVAPKGMRIGYASGSVVKTQCENATMRCEWTRATFDGDLACTPIIKNGAYGQCEVVNGACAPSATGSLTPSEDATITYGPNGEIIGVSAPNPNKKPDGSVNAADVFSCPNTAPGFANWVDCILEVTGNVYGLLTNSSKDLTGEGTGSVIGITKKIGQASGELSLTGVTADGANLADTVFRHTWNESWVGTENSPFRGFGVFALVMAVILVIIASIGAIALAASKR